MGYEPDPISISLAGAGFAVIFWFILLIYYLAILVPSMAIIVRRLRDAGYHWAFLFLAIGPSIAILIPVLNIIAVLVALPCFIALIVLLCQGSKPEWLEIHTVSNMASKTSKDNSLANSHTIKV